MRGSSSSKLFGGEYQDLDGGAYSKTAIFTPNVAVI